jgi:flagellar motor switch protein FliM
MDFTVMGRRNVLAVIAKILIQALDNGGQMFIVIPQPALTPIRQQLSRDLSSDGSASDPRWQKLMQEGVQKAGVRAVAILDEQTLSLGDIANWRVGDLLPLNATAASKLRLDCKSQPLFWCELGQAKGHYTLNIAERVNLDEMPLEQFLEQAGEAESC